MHDPADVFAKFACREVVEQSVQHLDGGDLDAFCALFSSDAILVRPGGGAIHGREEIRSAYAARPAGRVTRHLVTNVVVTLQGSGQARARSYVLLWSGRADGEPGKQGWAADARQLVGEFEDDLICQPDGSWRIQQRKARFVLHAEVNQIK